MMEQMGDSAWMTDSYPVSSNFLWDNSSTTVVPVVTIPKKWHEELDSQEAHITVLDMFGNLLWVNEAWRQFGRMSGSNDPHYGIGTNYLDICDRAHGHGSYEAGVVAGGIRQVIAGTYKSVYFRYGFECPDRRHLFAVRITQRDDHGVMRMCVAHERIM